MTKMVTTWADYTKFFRMCRALALKAPPGHRTSYQFNLEIRQHICIGKSIITGLIY